MKREDTAFSVSCTATTMNTAHFVTDRLIYIPDFVQLADAASLENNLASITDHSWRYDGGIKWVAEC